MDKNSEEGGLGLDLRTAKKIVQQLSSLAKELNISEALPVVDSSHLRDSSIEKKEEDKVISLRRALFDELNVVLTDFSSLMIIDSAILQRVRGEIDSKELFLLLDKPLKEGGAGLDRRLASKMIKRLEIWLIGHKE